MRSVVVLPAPLGPSSAWNSPRGIDEVEAVDGGVAAEVLVEAADLEREPLKAAAAAATIASAAITARRVGAEEAARLRLGVDDARDLAVVVEDRHARLGLHAVVADVEAAARLHVLARRRRSPWRGR